MNVNKAWVHMCFCFDGGDNITELIDSRPHQRLLLFYDALEQGPIKDLHLPSGMQAREEYWKTICSIDPAFTNQDLAYSPQQLGVSVLFPPPASNESVLLWHGESTCEQMMLRAVCAYWPNADLWSANVKRLKPWFPETFPAVPCFSPNALARLENMAERIKAEYQHQLAREWHELAQQNSVLRIVENEKIRGVSEDFFDAFLLNACTNEWQHQARVTGDCQANSGFSQVGDSYLLYRLHLMAQQGKVEIHGNERDHRLHKIRKSVAVN